MLCLKTRKPKGQWTALYICRDCQNRLFFNEVPLQLCRGQSSWVAKSWILHLLSPHGPPAAWNMEPFSIPSVSGAFLAPLFLCALLRPIFRASVCVFKCMHISALHLMWHPPIIPSHWLLSRLIPQTCHTSPPSALPACQRWGTTMERMGTLKPPDDSGCYEYQSMPLPLFFNPPWSGPFPLQLTAPHRLTISSTTPSLLTEVYTSASSCLACLSSFSCSAWQTKSVQWERWEEIIDRRRMKVCSTGFLIQRFLHVDRLWAIREWHICPRC